MSGTTDDRATNVQDAINLYEIGRFLEFNFLAQACEDLLMQLMSVENVVTILNWSLKPHGSAWISRQALQFLEEEFFPFISLSSFNDVNQYGIKLIKFFFIFSASLLLHGSTTWLLLGLLQVLRKLH